MQSLQYRSLEQKGQRIFLILGHWIVAFIISDCLMYVFSPKYLSSYCCCGWEHFGSNTFWFSLQRFHALSCICQGLQGWEGVSQDVASAGQEDLVIFLKWSSRIWTGKTASVATAMSSLVSILQEKRTVFLSQMLDCTIQFIRQFIFHSHKKPPGCLKRNIFEKKGDINM